MNKLPEKLNLLRKSAGLTQSEIAQRLLVPVAEYMNWENGNAIPSIDKLKEIALLYHTDLAALLDNTMSFVAPANVNFANNELTQSATIPFQKSNDIGATQNLGETRRYETIAPDTKQIASSDLQYVKEDTRPVRTFAKDSKAKKRKVKSSWIMGGVVAVAALAVGMVLFLSGMFSSHKVTTDNAHRLILTDTYTLYVSDEGNLVGQGEGYQEAGSALQGSVMLDAYGNNVIGIKKNGTAVVSESSLDVSGWKNLVQVAAGKDHVVGLKKDGTVVCTGSSSACDVEDWEDIESIYAGDNVTIGLTKKGSFVSAGGVGIPDVTGVKVVAVADSVVYYETSNGTISTISLKSDASALSTSALKDVKQLSASDDILVGVKSNGGVIGVSSDAEIQKTINTWSNVESIAVNGKTVVAMTRDGKMYGAGDNSHNQYVNTATDTKATASPTPTPSSTTKTEKLDEVTNITFSTTTQTLQIAWDKVENATYYIVSISPDLGELAKSTTNSISVPAADLKDGTTYTVSIKALAEGYDESTAVNVAYTYTSKTMPLDTPSNIQASVDSGGAWTITWDSVNHANSYTLSINGEVVTSISSTFFTISKDSLIGGQTYEISIVANSDDDTYTQSEEGKASLQYHTDSANEEKKNNGNNG